MEERCYLPLLSVLVVNIAAGLLAANPAGAQGFDFFYLVQQWPGSYCDTDESCCYPSTGKPAADFGIHGLWPNNDDGSYPSNCDSSNPFDPSKIENILSSLESEWPSLACPSSNDKTFWSHEWDKHGTCSESVLDEHDYFNAALSLKQQAGILGALQNEGINPDGSSYSTSSITQAIAQGVGHQPGIECNTDSSGNSQLYQVYLCADTSAANFIDCPVLPSASCPSDIHFPSF